ncbi:hypothetical protein BpHYR1_053837 [Brachionus plicatilis]|uniref:Uncharacterized protein n=1 Tax=Brachionus plicatilis TaxID=10195 RepID=A0A3M7R504_BRAPC|nr:hypothetical protein BpHYR1_053837 [Brachionus plicatilis]
MRCLSKSYQAINGQPVLFTLHERIANIEFFKIEHLNILSLFWIYFINQLIEKKFCIFFDCQIRFLFNSNKLETLPQSMPIFVLY